MSDQVFNIAGYRFIDLHDRDELRDPFMNRCTDLGLKGTILLSPNGINFFLAGSEESVSEFIQYLESDRRFSGIPIKFSRTDYQPFRRMNVRLKNEIISIGLDHIKPADRTGEEITPTDFKKLLDDGEDILVPVSYTHLTLPTKA